jgi:hypothetical protein
MSTFKPLSHLGGGGHATQHAEADHRQASSCAEWRSRSRSKSSSFIPNVEYMKYLLAGSVALARYVAVMLKDGGFIAIRFDLLFLVGLGIATSTIVTPVFKRTL